MTRALEVFFGEPLPWIADPGLRGVHARRVEALAARVLGIPPPRIAEHFERTPILEHAHWLLREKGHGREIKADATQAIYALAMRTGDLPNFLGAVGQRIIANTYDYGSAVSTVRRIALPRIFQDFRPHTVVRLDALPGLAKLNEGGEVQRGAVSDGAETITLAKYARRIGFTREAVLADDVSGLRDLLVTAGQRTAAFVNDLFFETAINPGSGLGPTLSDGVAVYNAAHANVASAGVLSDTTLSEARWLLRKQIAGDVKLNIPGGYLLVAPDYQQTAEKLVAGIALAQRGADAEAPMRVLADANLVGPRFYLLAPLTFGSNYILGRLRDEAERPLVVAQEDWAHDSTDFTISLSVAVAPCEWRFGASGAGA